MPELTRGVSAAVLAALVCGLLAAPAGADPDGAETTEPAEPAPTAEAAPTSEPSQTAEATPTAGPPETAEPSQTVAGQQVTYTVTTTSDLTANIYYITADPPDQGAANDPRYMPLARTPVGPGAPWTFQTTLADPAQWAFVSASGGLRVNPEFRCEIAVDGQVVVTQQGGSGVQCALRPW